MSTFASFDQQAQESGPRALLNHASDILRRDPHDPLAQAVYSAFVALNHAHDLANEPYLDRTAVDRETASRILSEMLYPEADPDGPDAPWSVF